jgi:hypothetical protein
VPQKEADHQDLISLFVYRQPKCIWSFIIC